MLLTLHLNLSDIRRPKASTSVKLRKIAEGSSWLAHSRSVTHGRPAVAEGTVAVDVVLYVEPGGSLLLGCGVQSRGRSLRSGATGTCRPKRGQTDTLGGAVQSLGTAAATLLGVTADTSGRSLRTKACGYAGVTQGASNSMCGSVTARGVRNISDDELVAVVRCIDRRR